MDISKLPDIDAHINTLQFALETIAVIMRNAETNQIETHAINGTFDGLTRLSWALTDERDRAIARGGNHVQISTT